MEENITWNVKSKKEEVEPYYFSFIIVCLIATNNIKQNRGSLFYTKTNKFVHTLVN